jgi:L-asparagine transporter-like permease
MDLLDLFLGRDRRGGDSVTDTIQGLSRWIFRCGCLLILAVIVGIALVVGGVVQFGTSAINVIVVFIMIIVAVASLIRASIGQ